MTSTAVADLERARRPVKRELEKLAEEAKVILDKKEKIDPKDVKQMTFIEDLMRSEYDKLLLWNERIAEQLVVDKAKNEDQDKEFDDCRKVKFQYMQKMGEIEDFLKKYKRDPSPSSSSRTTVSKNVGYKLPKIEIPVFSGNHKDWLGWWATFSRIHNNPAVDPADKFTYLKQAMKEGSKAKDLIERYPASAENYPVAIQALEERFGDKDILIDVYVRELQALMIANASKTSSKEKKELGSLFDKIQTYLNALDTLGTIDKSHFLYPMVESCLPVQVMRAWQRSSSYEEEAGSSGTQSTKLDRLLKFLAKEVKGEARIAMATNGYQSTDDRKDERKSRSDKVFRKNKPSRSEDLPTAMELVSLDKKEKCLFCEKNHSTTSCWSYRRTPLEERKKKIQESGKCFNCLKGQHSARQCKETVLCSDCGGRHHKVLCGKATGPRNNEVPPPAVQVPAFPAYQYPAANPSAAVPNMALTNFNATPDILLPTLSVGITDANGKVKRIRAAIDTMSGHTYISKNVADKLKISPVSTAVFKHAVFGGGTKVVEHWKYVVTLQSLSGDFACKLEAYDQELIASGIPSVPSRGVFEELLKRGIILSDHPSQRNQPIDLLIGGDIAGKLWTGPPLQLDCGPTAFQTRFGWTVMGKSPIEARNKNVFVEHTLANLHSPEAMWELEAIGITDPATKLSRKEEDDIAIKFFEKSVQRKEDGRYQVFLPWIEGHPRLPDNREVAKKRLLSATNKLRRQNMYQEYEEIFTEWLESGIIEEVTDSEEEKDVHYLPHRPVIKEDSTTTKVRPVFDASCKSFVDGKESACLNDCLVKGPNLLETIPELLLKFREDKVAATADIRKAFLMIEVQEKDRDFLRFLWWKNLETGDLRVFRHQRVVFGVNCSPFLLNAVIDHHLRAASDEDADTVDKLRSSLYVDNVVASFPDEKSFEKFKKRSTEILLAAKFDLRLWESNTDREIGPEPTKVLGIKWHRVQDSLFCDCSLDGIKVDIISKKTILAGIARVYDPLGMLAPVVLVPKLLYQVCCRQKLSWDESVPDNISREFLKWLKQMKNVKEASIPRYVGVPTPESSVHVFCDASEMGYAAVAYLRLVEADKVTVKFLFCRSRVTPLAKVTINRLELIACEIATRLAKTVRDALGWHDVPFIYWTDSTTAKAWILRDKDWGTFVGNRVRKILARTAPEDWKHVPGILNPADLPSRGCMLDELVQSSWWKGPSWLLEDPSCWPNAKPVEDEELILKELKKTKTVTAVNIPKEEPWYGPQRFRFGKWSQIVRVVAWILRFKKNALKRRPCRGPLSFEEKAEAEKKLFFEIQQEAEISKISFPFKIEKLEDGLYHVKTKLTYADEEEAFKCPVVLPGKHYLTELLVREEHVKNNHAGVQFLLAHLRDKVWIHQGRVLAKKVVHQCFICKRFRASPPDPETAPLPKNRMREAAPFEITGIDFAGPLYPRGEGKVWIALFTCAVYRAVHLELVPSLSTEAFLQSLRCFIARRGRPSVIYTDNGTNFVGAYRQLKNVDWNKIQDEGKVAPIKWIFSPPSAPWWGGWWERLVRSMKELIFRNIGQRVLYEDELRPMLCDIEATLNGRPLTYANDNDELVPLTPAIFLHGPRAQGTPDLDAVDRSFLLRRKKFRQDLMDNLRKRFRNEYLGHLVQRRKESKEHALQVGDVVLIGADNTKRVMWPVGVIERLVEGRDGITRVAQVRTKTGVLERPVQRLYPLEISSGDIGVTPERIEKVYRTRYGREVKVPSRYGH